MRDAQRRARSDCSHDRGHAARPEHGCVAGRKHDGVAVVRRANVINAEHASVAMVHRGAVCEREPASDVGGRLRVSAACVECAARTGTRWGGIGRMDTTRLPWKGPRGAHARCVLNIGTLLRRRQSMHTSAAHSCQCCSTLRTGTPCDSRAASNVNEQPM